MYKLLQISGSPEGVVGGALYNFAGFLGIDLKIAREFNQFLKTARFESKFFFRIVCQLYLLLKKGSESLALLSREHIEELFYGLRVGYEEAQSHHVFV